MFSKQAKTAVHRVYNRNNNGPRNVNCNRNPDNRKLSIKLNLNDNVGVRLFNDSPLARIILFIVSVVIKCLIQRFSRKLMIWLSGYILL